MSRATPVVRLVLFLVVIGAAAFTGVPSQSASQITFDDCTSAPPPTPAPTPSSSAEPTATPKPTPTPSGPPPRPSATPAPQNCMPRTGERIWGVRTLRFEANPDQFQRLHYVTLFVRADEKSGARDAEGALFDKPWRCSERALTTYQVPWDSNADTPYNGKYKVAVSVTTYDNGVNCRDTTPSSAERVGLLVDNPPQPVGAPRIIALTDTTITVQWDKSFVPDLTRYAVMRASTNSTKTRPKYSDFKTVGFSTLPAFRDQVKPGVYWYSIVVTRRSVVTPDDGISSQMSSMSGPAEIKAPPPPKQGPSGPTIKRYIPLNRLALPAQTKGSEAIPDAPYSAQLPYGDIPESGSGGVSEAGGSASEPGGPATRGPVLPVAVGAFLVSAALALSRMPY